MPIKNPNQKLNDSKDMPKVEVLTDSKAIARYGGSRMLLAPPMPASSAAALTRLRGGER